MNTITDADRELLAKIDVTPDDAALQLIADFRTAHTQDLEQQLAQLRAKAEGLANVAETLHKRLLAIHENEEYLAVWTMWQNHIGPYKWPNYVDEYHALGQKLEQWRAK